MLPVCLGSSPVALGQRREAGTEGGLGPSWAMHTSSGTLFNFYNKSEAETITPILQRRKLRPRDAHSRG